MKSLLNKTVCSIMFLLVGLVVFFVNMTFKSIIQPPILLILQLSITAVLALLCFIFKKKGQAAYQDTAFSFLAASVALTTVSLFSIEKFGVAINTPHGIALAKLTDSAIIVAVIVFLFRFSKHGFDSIYIAKGRLALGITIGLVTFTGMVLLGPTKPGNEHCFGVLIAYLPWILLFVFPNAIMEELLFRGIFLKKMIPLIGAPLAILVTSLVFALAHIQATYQAPSQIIGFVTIVFILGTLWGSTMYKTNSLIAPVLFHAGADVLIIIDVFKSFGAVK
jgi:membrane protease YdiL (CAAX protease family)